MYAIASRNWKNPEGRALYGTRSTAATRSGAAVKLGDRFRYYERHGYTVRWNADHDAFVVEHKGKFHASFAMVSVE